jgi:hypothetical protein
MADAILNREGAVWRTVEGGSWGGWSWVELGGEGEEGEEEGVTYWAAEDEWDHFGRVEEVFLCGSVVWDGGCGVENLDGEGEEGYGVSGVCEWGWGCDVSGGLCGCL